MTSENLPGSENPRTGIISTTLQELFDLMQSGIMNVASVSPETAASAQEVAAAAEEMTSAMEGVSELAQSLADQAETSSQIGYTEENK